MRGPPDTSLRRQQAGPPDAPAPPASTDVAIIGGGVIGLMTGWRLLRAGLRVALFERGTVGQGASLAATGMLAAAAEFEPGGEEHVALALESQRLWPGFAAELSADGGLDIDYRRDGILLVATTRDEVARLRFRQEMQRQAGLVTEWLDGAACRGFEPGLRPSVVAGIHCPGDHQVDPAKVIAALRQAFIERGGILLEGSAATPWLQAGRAVGVTTKQGPVKATIIVAAGGAWTEITGLSLPLRPLKGQSLALACPPDRPLLSRMVWTDQVHLAPKSDGTLIVGATMEECGFDDAVTAGGVYALLEGARRILPGIEDLPIAAIWSGFRPTSADDAPILGATRIPGLLLATGHHRNGYLLAPVTAEAITQLITEGGIKGPAASFGPERFSAQEAVA
ncbi:glycine oxidase ThiO [Bosea vaviloviae]|uniref:Glycine oxidase ThiO n=1 Tax=Bosea vaviloviae TaxID=1526658 RepID=A0A1D7UBG1_9HYPH|nr:glycine oxidase ThiO [Bosea vaviloviae]AOO84723.1 glycine oxidase ThiO [Bosea vaviloviae]